METRGKGGVCKVEDARCERDARDELDGWIPRVCRSLGHMNRIRWSTYSMYNAKLQEEMRVPVRLIVLRHPLTLRFSILVPPNSGDIGSSHCEEKGKSRVFNC